MNERGAVPVRTVLASIAGVWLCYFAFVTVRSLVVDSDDLVEALARRGVVTAAGIAITIVMWLILRRLDARPLGQRIMAVLILALPAALAVAAINTRVFQSMDSNWMLSEGRTRLSMDKAGNFVVDLPGQPRITIRDPEAGPGHSMWKELTDIALGRYFLLLAWGALFLALGNAEEVRAAERRAAAFQRAAKAAELRSLRYQVNPHFLFNTLNSLSALVMTGRREDAETMIQTLSNFYRTSLTGDPTDDVPLSEEVRLQRLYLEIEAVRFPKRLKTAFDIPDALAGACVPGLILQPLVENAVKHGVAATNRAVTIAIRAVQDGDRLSVTVADDGGANGDSKCDGAGIGLANVRERLAARFGRDARFHAEGSERGFAVTLTMPLVLSGC